VYIHRYIMERMRNNIHFRDRKINATKYNINLLEKHIKGVVYYYFLTQIN